MAFTEINHYVPQWYQKRFLPSGLREQKLYYLDLEPERVAHSGGGFHFRNDCRRLGTVNCFAQRHLYTILFGDKAADVIEKRFFGEIDRLGAASVEFFSNYVVSEKSETALNNLLRFLDAQKLRTPKGLDFIKRLAKGGSHQMALHLMGQLWQYHITIWMEGVWEVLHCDQSATKFIITDHPVSTYNKMLFPLAKQCRYPFDAPIEVIGTHTIFPLDLNRCLIITNLGYVRNPWINPLRVRENPRYFAQTIFDIRKVQTGRQISEDYVLSINYILKRRARRYLAAAHKDWLFPERFLKTTMWNKLGDRFFLMPDPRKVSFTTEILVGYINGSAWGIDEYGRRPKENDPEVKERRDVEWETFQKAKRSWDNRLGPLSIEDLKRYS
jgi:hypothetical protein